MPRQHAAQLIQLLGGYDAARRRGPDLPATSIEAECISARRLVGPMRWLGGNYIASLVVGKRAHIPIGVFRRHDMPINVYVKDGSEVLKGRARTSWTKRLLDAIV